MNKNIKKLLVLYIFILFFTSYSVIAAATNEIIVTDVKLTPSKQEKNILSIAEITINNCLKIKEIKVFKFGERISLKFPEYISKRKRVYPQVTILTRQANEVIKNAVITGKPTILKTNKPLSFKVEKFSKFKQKSNLKVLITISFNDSLLVETKIIESKNGPWIAWPSRKSAENKKNGKSKWIKQVMLVDKKFRETVEQDLFDKYYSTITESDEEYDE